MFLTRLLTTLAHLYNLVGWLKMKNPPPPPPPRPSGWTAKTAERVALASCNLSETAES